MQLRNVVMFNTAITLSQGWSLALLVTHSMRHWAGMGGTQACSNESMAKLADDQDSVSIFGLSLIMHIMLMFWLCFSVYVQYRHTCHTSMVHQV